MPFPADARGAEVQGIDLVLLDSLVAGCVSSIVDAAAPCDPDKWSKLAGLAEQLRSVSAQLDGESRQYFAQLSNLADAALRVEEARRR
jgi:hypothetical protein